MVYWTTLGGMRMGKRLSAFLLSGLITLGMVSCGGNNTPSLASSPPVISNGIRPQNSVGEQLVTMEMMASLESAGWVSINASRLILGGVLAAGIHVAMNNLVINLMLDDSPMIDDYLSLLNAEDKARIAEVFLLMEGLPHSLNAARATMNDTAAFNQRVATAAAIVLSEKRDKTKQSLNLQDLWDIALTNVTTSPPPPNPGDPCNKGFPNFDKWDEGSDLVDHFIRHAADFKIDTSIVTEAAKESYIRAAGNFLKDAARARGVGFIVRFRPATGDLVIGQPSTRYFGIFSKTGAAKTFYKWTEQPGKTFSDYVLDSSHQPTERPSDDWYKGDKGTIDADGKCR